MYPTCVSSKLCEFILQEVFLYLFWILLFYLFLGGLPLPLLDTSFLIFFYRRSSSTSFG